MRRLLSPVACWSYTPPDGGGLAPLLPPPHSLNFSHSQSRVSVGLGRAAVRPSLFLEVMRVEMTHEEMDALLQRYDGLPVPMAG